MGAGEGVRRALTSFPSPYVPGARHLTGLLAILIVMRLIKGISRGFQKYPIAMLIWTAIVIGYLASH
jgi:hypothetical protein